MISALRTLFTCSNSVCSLKYCTEAVSNNGNGSRKRCRGASDERRYSSACGLLKDFCDRTSSHGIPLIGTIIEMQLKFEPGTCEQTTYIYMCEEGESGISVPLLLSLMMFPAPFPAATVCNLNAFKNSELRKHEAISEGLDVWEEKINRYKGSTTYSNISVRKRREVSYVPVFVRCNCVQSHDNCVPQRNPLLRNATVCICFEDINTGNIWPCYPIIMWTEKQCFECSLSKTCDDPDRRNPTTLRLSANSHKCLCQFVSNNCVIVPKGDIRWWDPNNYTIFSITQSPTTSLELAEAFGMTERQDPAAMTAKAKENLIFMVAALPFEIRRNLSYKLKEFVLRCSFNSEDCNLERDFKLHMDPEYGNCYTFNFNDSVELKNSRAGPMYGLRLLLNVNQSDYLPTTEAAGVRLVVHEQDHEPFPDTFGYSAPTGVISSFGLKTKVLHRLDGPYGMCSDTFRPTDYIYAEHYSPEGCYRNCFQHTVLERCGCGDPRFPLHSDDYHPCSVKNATERSCLRNFTQHSGGFHHIQQNCGCVQPCNENVFETAYSAAAWPAKILLLESSVQLLSTSQMILKLAPSTIAYIEIYYEQLNFETLREIAGYSIVNLFSDFGGNIGLWIGFSIITMMEIVELVCEMCYYLVYRRPMQMAQRRNKVLVGRQFRFRTSSSSLLSTAIDRSMTAESSLEFEDIDHNMPRYHRIHHCIYRNTP
ncbi:Degenerin unc-8 [Dirofilaria immitis]|nr:Degenerin unc-8 [Dirofilaria immitis]